MLASGRKSPYLECDAQIFECIRKGYLPGSSLRKFVKEASTRIIRKDFPDFRCSESCVTRIIERFHQKAEGGSEQSFHNNSLDTTETFETEMGTQEHQPSGTFEMEMDKQPNIEYVMRQWTSFDEQKPEEEEAEKYDTFQEQNQYVNDFLINQETAQNEYDICAEIFPTVFQDMLRLSSTDENEVFSWKD